MDTITLPPKLYEIIDDNSFEFPTDFPVVSNTNSPDATRTLKAVIEYSVLNHFYNHRINTYIVADFSRQFQNRLYTMMSQHQYWIDEYLKLIDDNQFFYNEEWNDGGTHTVETNERNASSTSNALKKSSDTPQNMVGDIDVYLSSAEKDDASDSGTEDGLSDNTFTTTLHTKKSTLGDITVQFRNFAEFPNFLDKIITSVKPCFMMYYGAEEIDYGTSE